MSRPDLPDLPDRPDRFVPSLRSLRFVPSLRSLRFVPSLPSLRFVPILRSLRMVHRPRLAPVVRLVQPHLAVLFFRSFHRPFDRAVQSGPYHLFDLALHSDQSRPSDR